MIISFIFLVHIVFAGYIFFKKKQESIGAAIQNLILIIILFSVGWSILTLILQGLIEPDGFGVEELDRNTIILTLLTVIEFFFYKMYYGGDESLKKKPTSSGKETQ